MTDAPDTTGTAPAPAGTRSPIVRLALRGAVFLTLNAVLAVVVLKAHETTLHYQPWETDSILLTMPENTHKNLVFLGTSRAYLFSRFKEHHEATESILGRTVFNLALPQGGGIKPERFYLESYFESGNTAGRVVYFLDPFVFYSTGANENHKFVYFEPFRFRFLAKLVWNGYGYRQIISYIRSKFSGAWLFQKPELLIHHTAHTKVEYVEHDRIKQRLDSLYYEGQPEAAFKRYTAEFLRVVDLCKAENVPLTIVVLPTLLGPEPGHEAVMEFLASDVDYDACDVHDWVNAMPDYTQFYNLDHMNLSGVKRFMGEFIRPALKDNAPRNGRVEDTR